MVEKSANNAEDSDEARPSYTMPTMPSKKPDYKRVVLYDSSNRDLDSIDSSNADKDNPDTDSSSEAGCLRTEIERAIETPRKQTPAMTYPSNAAPQ